MDVAMEEDVLLKVEQIIDNIINLILDQQGTVVQGQLVKFAKKEGYDALWCWHQFDHNYKADDVNKIDVVVTNNYSVDPNWYANTGVTDHITNDLDSLTTKEQYIDNDQV